MELDRSRAVGFLINDVGRLFRRRFERRAKALGLKLIECKALGYLARKSAEGEIVTGLLYVDPDASDLHDAMNTVTTPLNKLTDADLVPPLSALEKINASLR